MARTKGSDRSWQPMLGAPADRRRLLGSLLRLRRARLGYRYVPAFLEDRDINTRMVGDVEHGRRDTFTFPALEEIAAAYEVTYESMMAVVWSDAGELVPAAPDDPVPSPPAILAAPVPAVPAAPPPGWVPPTPAFLTAEIRPYADRIWQQWGDLRGAGVADPDGSQLFGPGTPDAQAWDGVAARQLPLPDRVWLIADLQRWDAARAGNPGPTRTAELSSR